MLCEECGKNEGETNSSFKFDDDELGIWICHECEQEAEIEHNDPDNCPCCCGGDDSKCVYATRK